MVDYAHLGDEVPYSVANLYMRDREGLYTAMARSKFVLPTLNCPLVTM